MQQKKWRVIPLETHPASMNMALDEAVSDAVKSGKAPSTIRFYKWKPGAVSIGYFQSMNDEVDMQLAEKKGIDVVRRRTGGGAVYHDPKGEITYSVIGLEEIFPKDITESYRLICGWVSDSLKELGIESGFRPINDIVAGEKKISGNAQTRRGRTLLQHGTVLYGLDISAMFSLLRVPKEKISDKFIEDVRQRVTCVLDLMPGVTEAELVDALVAGFTSGKDFEFGAITEEELSHAKRLAQERYSSKEWNFMR